MSTKKRATGVRSAPHIPYLNEVEYSNLESYKHFAPKTTFEKWMIDNVTCHIEEKIIPQHWTANSITILGNIPMVITGIVAISYGGVSYHTDEHEELPRWVFLLCAFSFLWFSWFDIMDG